MNNPKDIVASMVEKANNIGDLKQDYDFSRETYHELIRRGLETLDEMQELARDAEHPRAYEVLLQGIKGIADTNDKLANLHRKFQVMEMDGKESVSEETLIPIESERTSFSGTSEQLLKAIENVAKDAEFEEIDEDE